MHTGEQSLVKLSALISESIAVADAIDLHAVAALLEHAQQLLTAGNTGSA